MGVMFHDVSHAARAGFLVFLKADAHLATGEG